MNGPGAPGPVPPAAEEQGPNENPEEDPEDPENTVFDLAEDDPLFRPLDDIFGDNLGAKRGKAAAGVTDKDGTFTRLIGPRPGYTYFPWTLPKGYERVDGKEAELPSPVGTEKVEHVFKLRKKKGLDGR